MLTGRPSLSIKGITVHLGIIDADYQGEIQIMMSSVAVIQFQVGDRRAQLILLPYISMGQTDAVRKGGFGSMDTKNMFFGL